MNLFIGVTSAWVFGTSANRESFYVLAGPIRNTPRDGGRIRTAEIHWYEAHGVGNVKLKDQEIAGRLAMKTRRKNEIKFAVCINDSEPDLELRKVYKVLPDEAAAKDHHLRIIDESGEDYLYPASFFVFVEVPKAAACSQAFN